MSGIWLYLVIPFLLKFVISHFMIEKGWFSDDILTIIPSSWLPMTNRFNWPNLNDAVTLTFKSENIWTWRYSISADEKQRKSSSPEIYDQVLDQILDSDWLNQLSILIYLGSFGLKNSEVRGAPKFHTKLVCRHSLALI